MLVWRRFGEVMQLVMHWMVVPGFVLVVGGQTTLIRILAAATLASMALLLIYCGLQR